MAALSTKQETETAAVSVAFQWLQNGIPQKNETIPFKKYSLRDIASESDISQADCKYICKELQRRGMLKSYVISESKQATDFAEYLRGFWDFDTSPYVQEKLRKSHGIHRTYVLEQQQIVKRFWIPYFQVKLLGEISKQDIGDFISCFDTDTLVCGVSIPKSPKRKNTIIRAGTIPLSWAFQKEMIEKDITKGIIWFSGKSEERQILTPDLAAALFRVPWNDERARLANMLAMTTGMRAGEIQGLRVQDLGKDCLYVQHSWNFIDGLKTTKNNKPRMVEVPFPSIIQELLRLAKRNPHGPNMESFVFWAERSSSKPMESEIFLRDFRSSLVTIGMSKETAAGYTFHGWRHFFTSYMIGKLDNKLLKSQTGHLTDAMLSHYGEHRTEKDRQTIQAMARETFGKLLPYQQPIGE